MISLKVMKKTKPTTKAKRTRYPKISHYETPTYSGPFFQGIRIGVSRYLVYGLTDPDTKEIRYVGRSSIGLARPSEHATRIGRETTYKANWIRGLLKRGQMYGVRVLQEYTSQEEAISGEIGWIAEGRRLGWNLTNLTDGGEGSAGYLLKLPDEDIVSAYLKGDSELSLSKRFGVNRWTITRRLRDAGIIKRGASEANKIRMSRLSKEERLALVSSAHAAWRLSPSETAALTAERPCAYCGENFVPKHKHRPSLYCNPACGLEARRSKSRKPIQACGTHAAYAKGCRCATCRTGETRYRKSLR
jgi:hypothetical protein